MQSKTTINLQNWVAHYEIIILHPPKTTLLDTSQIGMTGITSNSRLCPKDKNKTTLSKKPTNNFASSNFYYPPNIVNKGKSIRLRYKKRRNYACLPLKWSLFANTPKINIKRRRNISGEMKNKSIQNHSMR